MEQSRYHKFLRVSALIIAFILVFDGGFISPLTKQLSDNTVNYLANSIGISASVHPNELNVITAEFTAREKALDAREAGLADREIKTRDFGQNSVDYSTYILSTILFILLVLILLNYALDWAHYRHLRHERKAA